jgi:hypothetical protein
MGTSLLCAGLQMGAHFTTNPACPSACSQLSPPKRAAIKEFFAKWGALGAEPLGAALAPGCLGLKSAAAVVGSCNGGKGAHQDSGVLDASVVACLKHAAAPPAAARVWDALPLLSGVIQSSTVGAPNPHPLLQVGLLRLQPLSMYV